MSVYRFALALVLIGICSTPLAHENCTQAEAKTAEEGADSMANWSQLHKAFTRFKFCDDGAIAEGYSDSVVRLLIEQWRDVSDLQKTFDADQGFEVFVLRHVDELMSPTELTHIQSNATNSCPSGAHKFCQKIIDRVGAVRSGGA
jgi:hypothetical protein